MLVLPVLLMLGCTEANETMAPSRLAAVAQANLSPYGAIDDLTAIVDAVTAAWTAKDAAAYAAPYAPDVQVVSPLGGLLNGRAGFAAQHVFLFNGPFAGSTQTITIRDIVFLTGTVALVLQDVSLTGYAFLPPGLPSSGGVVRNRVAWVVQKRDGNWEIVYQQMTPQLS
jgi:uncharacterized protein (TIGR02246 family)